MIKKVIILLSALFITACSAESIDFAGKETPDFTRIEEPPAPPTTTLKKESFTQNTLVQQVDILVVVDNSTSMLTEQAKMGDRFPSFLDGLGDLEWQIGITTTDVSDGAYGLKGSLLQLTGANSYILDESIPNYEQVFKDTVQRPETDQYCSVFYCPQPPSGYEMPLLASIQAMEKHQTDNAGFFRPNTDLVILILSDEDESSDGNHITQPQEVLDKFHSIFGNTKKLFAYSIIVEPNDLTCLDTQLKEDGTANYGDVIADLVQLTGGTTGSICSADYTKILKDIGQNVRDLIQSVQLSDTPKPGSIKVVFDPQQNIGWKVQDKSIIFDKAPLPDTKISVEYETLVW